MKSKRCSRCGVKKPITDFYNTDAYCKECRAEYKRSIRDKLRRADREYQLERLYGLSIEEHDKILAEQDEVCAGCGATSFNDKSYHLAVDHDHETGKVRGLLCLKCNRILGLADDNPEILRNLADYLESNQDAGVGSPSP
jgi:hypothetical protein